MNPAIVFARASARTAQGDFIQGACATAEEKEQAHEKCWASQSVHGLGEPWMFNFDPSEIHYAYDDSRWAMMPPCEVEQLPTCDCPNALDVMAMMPCFAGTPGPAGWTQAQTDNWCAQRGAGLVGRHFCPGTTLPPLPSCMTAEEVDGLGYCTQHGFTGPDPYANGLCWGAIQSGQLDVMLGMPICQSDYQPGPNDASPPFVPPRPPPVTIPGGGGAPSRTERSGMLLPGLILLLIAGGGTAYYLAQRKGKR